MSSKAEPERRANIRQVAEAAQVSPTTASLALRGASRIPEVTRARVRAAAEALNYVYAPRDARPARPAVRRITFVMHDYGHHPVWNNPFFGQVLQGAEQACSDREASLSLSVLLHSHPPTSPLPAALRPGEVHGLLVNGPYPQEIITRLAREVGCPLVLIDNMLPGLRHNSVMADDLGGGYIATRHLIERGYRSIVMVIGQEQIPSLRERQRGYLAACADAGIALHPPLTTSHTWDLEVIERELAPQLLGLPRPFGLFCAVGDYATAALNLFRANSVNVPGEVGVVGFDDLDPTRRLYPQLSAVHSHPRVMGQQAVRRLLALLDGDDGPHQHLQIGVELIVRQTS